MININQFLILAPALILAILSGYMSERVGVINIAINGMMIFGSVFFNIFSNVFYQAYNQNDQDIHFAYTFLASFLISCILGVLVGVLFGFATIKLKCDHIIAGTGINLIAAGIGLIIADNAPLLFKEQTALSMRYLYVGETVNGVAVQAIICFLIGLFIVGSIFMFMNFTKYGTRYKSIGENPQAADAVGINVIKYKWLGLLFVGAIAALAGSLFSFSLLGSSFSGDVDGIGFIALALLIVSSWRIIPSFVLGLFFALLYVFINSTIGGSEIVRYYLRTIPFILTLVVMLVFGKFSLVPKALGKHFYKGT